jgi:acyl-CoA thioesterase I
VRQAGLFLAFFALIAVTVLWMWRRQNAQYQECRLQLDAWRQDWAGLNHYKEDNARVAKLLPGLRPEAVFFGDSGTEFWDLSHFFPEHDYLNRGVQTQTTAQMLIRFRQDVIDLKPCSVVILAGTGDIAGNTGPATLPMIENNLESMVQLAKANGINVFVASLLPVHDHGKIPATRKRSPQQLAALNAWIQDYCRNNGCYFINYWSAMVDATGMMRPEVSEDGAHPNAEGYRVMAPVAKAALQTARCSPLSSTVP